MRPESKADENVGAPTSRRQFLRGTTSAVAAFTLIPRQVLGGAGTRSANEKLNLACIGVGGRGAANLKGVRNENIVALCDVDLARAKAAIESQPKAKLYRDFRKLLDEMDKSIDGVVLSTPDHTHAVAGVAAIQRGKHLYCEKPLAHSIGEVRALQQAARKHKVVTQLGNQGHSSDSIRTFCEWIWDGAIGAVHTVHAACGSNYSRIDQLPLLQEQHEVPTTLDWDLWLGPAATRPYHPAYLPGKWRGWMPFGCGVIGDWVCHVVDPVFWALDLGAPATLQAQAKNYDPQRHADTFPSGTVITYEFAAKGSRGPVKLVWFDGAERIPRPADMDPEDKVPPTGAIVFGDKGTIKYGSHGAGGVRLVPEARMQAYTRPAKSLPRVKGHYEDWLEAIRQGKAAGSHFDYGGPLTELALLGVIATRLLGAKLEWDGRKGRFTNSVEANRLLNPPHRPGWEV
jgi:predicted dehydrogenase